MNVAGMSAPLIRAANEWRCRCGKLLGTVERGRLKVLVGRRSETSHDYRVSFPVDVTCWECGHINRRESAG